MYKCRHCGLEYMTDEAVMCPRCQAPKGKGNNFCPFCGAQVTPEEHVCKNCGVDMDHYGENAVKSKVAAGLLAIFLGSYGVHNFYLGYYKKAAVQLGLTILGLVIYIVAIVSIAISGEDMSGAGAVGFLFSMFACVVMLVGVSIWVFVEGIMILCGKINKDGKGRMLK